MVLTVPVRMGDGQPVHTRRAVLRAVLGGALAAGPLAACTADKPAAPPAPDPLTPFYRATEALLARYEAVIAAQPDLADRLGPLRDDHRAHVQALARELGFPSPAPAASGATQPPADGGVAALQAAEKEAAAAAYTACLTAPSYHAALLGSIAACRSSHVEVLA
jgi:hypothetical protein